MIGRRGRVRGGAAGGASGGRGGGAGGSARAAGGGEVIYGWHSSLAALGNPRRHVRRVVATDRALQRLLELGFADLPEAMEGREIDRLLGQEAVHQGIAVWCDPLPEPRLDDLEGARLVLALDQVTDPHNVGAILRSAAAFGAEGLILTERHGPAQTGVLAKAASGALEHVQLVRVKNLARAMAELGAMGFYRIGLDSAHSQTLDQMAFAGPVALALGAEGAGLRRLTREHCDQLVRLDVPGPIKSLNVSNAAAVALYALTRRAPS